MYIYMSRNCTLPVKGTTKISEIFNSAKYNRVSSDLCCIDTYSELSFNFILCDTSFYKFSSYMIEYDMQVIFQNTYLNNTTYHNAIYF